ncbi:NfeD family protein [Rhodococcus coprophilus]|uniref:NfeD-like C-terminal, partner-binding n=1 Tax=Rhodococcus coprophilus TaxID=38310 RepID=A0A2X4TR06_9NOCA|nr:NfeD family protein [Rhodococcus coprophilus]MBM7461007.1 membrane protein implicated in regulation of membrane protease activity [Rhodococcus coprophilus]SQI28809.1 NfeD-like C-terminal, partner-binding [Rhodococcus coprophilus]
MVLVAALIWLIAGVALAAAEALTGDFVLLMLGGAALGTAAVTAVTDAPVWIDAVVFAVFSLVLLLGVRPILRRRYSVPPALTMGVEALPGKHALVLEQVGEHAGRVKIDGDVWTARPLDVTEVYEPGTTVTVMQIDGATAVVWRGV